MDTEPKSYFAIGLMSGTSLDGVDAALLDTDGETIHEVGPGITLEYSNDLRSRLSMAIGSMDLYEIMMIENELMLQHAEAVKLLITKTGIPVANIGAIGLHGQTVLHMPDMGATCQVGNPSLLAAHTGISVVSDFRRMDMAFGGQGAPLVPLFHQALAKDLPKPLAVINIGGVANVTWISADDDLMAFDTGPGNAMINDVVQMTLGAAFDKDGQVAASGKINEEIIKKWMEHPYFEASAPKSLDRNSFAEFMMELQELETADAVATLTEFTATSIASSMNLVPEHPDKLIVCGGGRLNPVLMKSLTAQVGCPVVKCEEVGWNGDTLEAQAFAYLAMRSIRGLPLSLPTTTGTSRAVTGGAFYRAVPGDAQ